MFSSHILSEVQNLCDKVVIINKGQIIAKDTVENLNKYLKIKPRIEVTIPGLNGEIPESIKKIDGIESINIKNDVLFITCDSSERINIISEIKNKGFDVKDIKTIEPSLEEAFMKLIFKDDEVK
jgi:ABC-2 type transport system ATP-binding protein